MAVFSKISLSSPILSLVHFVKLLSHKVEEPCTLYFHLKVLCYHTSTLLLSKLLMLKEMKMTVSIDTVYRLKNLSLASVLK